MAISASKLPMDKAKKMFKKALTSEEIFVENPLNLFLNQNNKQKNEPRHEGKNRFDRQWYFFIEAMRKDLQSK